MQNITVRNIITITILLVGTVFVYTTRYYQDGIGASFENFSDYRYITDLTLWQRTQNSQLVGSKIPFDLSHNLSQGVPLEIGNWRGEDIPQTDINALIMLEPEQFVERLYTNDKDQFLWFTVIGSRKSRAFHPPVACYDADGWETKSINATIPLIDEGSLNAVLLDATKFYEDTNYQSRQLSAYFYLFPDHNRDLNNGLLMLRVTSPVYDSVEATVDIYGEFLSLFFSVSNINTQGVPAIFDLENPVTVAELDLTNYTISHQEISSGNVLGIDLNWLPQTQISQDYLPHISIQDDNGLIWSERQNQRPQVYEPPPSTIFWQPQKVVLDRHEVTLLSGTPPGQYNVVLTMFNKDKGEELSFSQRGVGLGTSYLLGKIKISSSQTSVYHQSQSIINKQVAGAGRLVDSNLTHADAIPGSPIFITLFWERDEDSTYVNEVNIKLYDAQDSVVQNWLIPPVSLNYPPSEWGNGELLRGQHKMLLRSDLASGTYELKVGKISLGFINVRPLNRSFQPPAYSYPMEASFDHSISLVGYTINSTNTVSLVWYALTDIVKSYKVFVHLVDDNGEIIAQSDAEPVNWTRPTSSWISGEYVVDIHELSLPDNQQLESLFLRIGLYDPTTGSRLLTDTGDDFVLLPYDSTLD